MTQIVHRISQVPHPPVRCHRCAGTGRAPCQVCYGSGEIKTGRDRFGRIVTARCPGCFGSKVHRCAHCRGEGFV